MQRLSPSRWLVHLLGAGLSLMLAYPAQATLTDLELAQNGGRSPQRLVSVDNKLFFNATDSTNTPAFWVSDGTPAGSMRLKNTSMTADTRERAVLNGKLLFSAHDNTSNYELWVSDGTASGTMQVKDIHTSGSSFPSYLTVFNDKLYFAADDGTTGLNSFL